MSEARIYAQPYSHEDKCACRGIEVDQYHSEPLHWCCCAVKDKSACYSAAIGACHMPRAKA